MSRSILQLIVICFCLLGLSFCYRLIFSLWSVDDDIINPYMLWSGVTTHGLGFLKTWSYTADNWLLSLLPFDALAYAIFGATPVILVGAGWLVFVLNVLLAYAIGRSVTGRWYAGVLACFLVFPNYVVLGPAGMLGHPVTHNSSQVWCLFVLLCALRGITAQRVGWHFVSAVGALVVTLSDPWGIPALLLPIIVTAFALALWPRQSPVLRRNLWVLGLAMLIVGACTKSRLFGLWSFVPPYYFTYPTWSSIWQNLRWIVEGFGALFPMLPTRDALSETSWLTSLAIVVCLILWSLTRLLRAWLSLSTEQRFVSLFCVASMAAVVCGTTVGQLLPGPSIQRVLVNAYFYVPLLIAIAASTKPVAENRRFAAAVLVWVVLVMACSGVSWARTINAQAKESSNLVRSVKPWADFLAAHDLSYGYGPYWGAHANSVTWFTKGAVTIRPVRFDPVTGEISGQHEQSSTRWLDTSDVPVNQQRFFIAVGNDSEVCLKVEVCLTGVVRQFGQPVQILHFNTDRSPLTVFVWNHRLISPGTQLAAAPQITMPHTH